MTVNYKVIQRLNPQKPNGEKKYYATLVGGDEIDIRGIAEYISKVSTLSKIDTLILLTAVSEVIPQLMAEGRVIRLGRIGTFSLGISSEGCIKESEVNAKKIKRAKVMFRPSIDLKRSLDSLKFRKVKSH